MQTKTSRSTAAISSDPVSLPVLKTGARNYLLIALASISMTSWADRAVFNLLVEPIKRDLNLTDTQIGMLGGLAFATLYALLSVPIARVAERKSRLAITIIAVSVWSVMTMLCGAAANFWQLAVARAGVGIGESACLPCAQSMISDTFPPERRATAISIFSLGIPVGTVAGILGGAWIAEVYSWRVAFVAVGAPGLILGVIAAFTLKEPVRGRFDPPVSDTPPSLMTVLRHLWARQAFRHLLAGAAIGTMLNAGIGGFMTPFLMRGSFGLALTDLAMIGVFLVGVGTFAGALAGGSMADWLARRDQKWRLWVPAVAFIIAAPAWAGAFLADSLIVFIVLALIGQTAMAMYVAPTFGSLNNMVEPRMRATAVAIMGVVNSLVGLGLGPLLVGVISDYAAHAVYGADPAGCAAASSAACASAGYYGLRAALVVCSLLYLWPAYHYLRAGSLLSKNPLVRRPAEAVPAAN